MVGTPAPADRAICLPKGLFIQALFPEPDFQLFTLRLDMAPYSTFR